MRLKVKVTILRKKRYTPYSIVKNLEIFLNDQIKINLFLQRSISFHKFRNSPERIVRALNLHKKEIKFLRFYQDCDYDTWNWMEEKEFEISSFDLFKVRFSTEQRRIVEKALDGKLKTIYTKNPSKPKSQMEYRKRSYYGKCKK